MSIDSSGSEMSSISKDLNPKITPDGIRKMDIPDYLRFLKLLNYDGKELDSKKGEVVAERYEKDIDGLLKVDNEENWRVAQNLTKETQIFLHNMASGKVSLEPEIIEKFYSLLESENKVVRKGAIEFVSNLIHLDFQNKNRGEKFLGLYDRFMDNLARMIKDPKDSKEKSMSGLLFEVVYADFGKEARNKLLERIGINIETEAKVDNNHYGLISNIIKSGRLDDKAKEDIGLILSAWKETFNKSDNFQFRKGRINQMQADFWDKESMLLRNSLLLLVSNKNENTKIGSDLLFNLSKDPNFSKKNLLINYLAYEVWLANTPFELNKKIRDEDRSILERVKEVVYPNLREITVNLLHEGNTSDIDKYMDFFSVIRDTSFADSIIIDERLNLDEKTKFMVCFINQFGVMKGIDFLAGNMGKSDDIKGVYDRLQGKELKKRFAELQSLYSDVDFEKYNSPEFTQKEVDLIKGEVAEFSNKNNSEPKLVNILDIGAGTGRHAVALFRDGYSVTALEVQPNHVEKIKSKEPGLRVIPESWSDLSLSLDDDNFDFAYCLERTVLHNRTPQDMLKFFDNTSQVLSDNGRLMIDFADTTVGEYRDRVDKYKDNLKSLGVKETVVQHIFDGVDEDHQFNRMAPSKEQIEAYTKLVGLRLVKEPIADVVEKYGEITNNYYVFEKDPDFEPNSEYLGNTLELFKKIGIYNEGVDYDQMIKSLGMTIGQVVIYGVDNDQVKINNSLWKPPHVMVTKDDKGRLLFETSREGW